MIRQLLLLVLSCCLLTLPAGADDTDKAPAQKSPLDGVWKIESAKQDGEDFAPPVGDQIHFAADKMTIKMKSRDQKIEITIKTDTTKTPHHLDLAIKQEGAPPTVHAVFEVKGDTLRLCMPRQAGERPESVESQAGSGTVSIVAKRAKDEE